MKKKFECAVCDGYGSISHNLDPEFFEITVCPFCGADISDNSDEDDDE